MAFGDSDACSVLHTKNQPSVLNLHGIKSGVPLAEPPWQFFKFTPLQDAETQLMSKTIDGRRSVSGKSLYSKRNLQAVRAL